MASRPPGARFQGRGAHLLRRSRPLPGTVAVHLPSRRSELVAQRPRGERRESGRGRRGLAREHPALPVRIPRLPVPVHGRALGLDRDSQRRQTPGCGGRHALAYPGGGGRRHARRRLRARDPALPRLHRASPGRRRDCGRPAGRESRRRVQPARRDGLPARPLSDRVHARDRAVVAHGDGRDRSAHAGRIQRPDRGRPVGRGRDRQPTGETQESGQAQRGQGPADAPQDAADRAASSQARSEPAGSPRTPGTALRAGAGRAFPSRAVAARRAEALRQRDPQDGARDDFAAGGAQALRLRRGCRGRGGAAWPRGDPFRASARTRRQSEQGVGPFEGPRPLPLHRERARGGRDPGQVGDRTRDSQRAAGAGQSERGVALHRLRRRERDAGARAGQGHRGGADGGRSRPNAASPRCRHHRCGQVGGDQRDGPQPALQGESLPTCA